MIEEFAFYLSLSKITDICSYCGVIRSLRMPINDVSFVTTVNERRCEQGHSMLHFETFGNKRIALGSTLCESAGKLTYTLLLFYIYNLYRSSYGFKMSVTSCQESCHFL